MTTFEGSKGSEIENKLKTKPQIKSNNSTIPTKMQEVMKAIITESRAQINGCYNDNERITEGYCALPDSGVEFASNPGAIAVALTALFTAVKICGKDKRCRELAWETFEQATNGILPIAQKNRLRKKYKDKESSKETLNQKKQRTLVKLFPTMSIQILALSDSRSGALYDAINKHIKGANSIGIFGSFRRNEMKENSDIDIAVQKYAARYTGKDFIDDGNIDIVTIPQVKPEGHMPEDNFHRDVRKTAIWISPAKFDKHKIK